MQPVGYFLIIFLAGLAMGGGLLAFIRKHDRRVSYSDHEAAKLALTQSQTMLSLAEQTLADTKSTLAHTTDENTRLRTHLTTLQADYRNLEQVLTNKTAEYDQMTQKFTAQFENLANRILDEKTAKFTKQNQENLTGILQPLNEKLVAFKERIEKTYNHESRERASLQGEIKRLVELNQTMAKEASNLVAALKGDTKVQGNWGELILEKILERSGLKKGVEFEAQRSFITPDGKRQQPDVILNLPENKQLIIDSKVSLVAYEKCMSAESDLERDVEIKNHVASLRKHMKDLSVKNYQDLYDINCPDFVLMFMPIEPAFGLAVQHDPSLFYDALDQHVVMVTPSTLLVTLQIINNMWRQDRQNKNTMEIAQRGGALYDKVVLLVNDFIKLGNQLETTTKTYDSVMSKLSTGKGNLIKQTEYLKTLGAKTQKQLPEAVLDAYDDVMDVIALPE